MSKTNMELVKLHNILYTDCVDIPELFENMEDINNKLVEFNNNEKGYLSLILKYLVKTNNIKWLVIVVNDNLTSENHNLRINDLLLLVKYFDTNIEHNGINYLLEQILDILFMNNHITSKCIEFFVSNNLDKYLDRLDGHWTLIDDINIRTIDRLQRIDKEKYSLLENYMKLYKSNTTRCIKELSNKFNKQTTNLYINNINKFVENILLNYSDKKVVCIDCGNILHGMTNGTIIENSYNILIQVIEKVKSLDMIPLIIIHTRHLDLSKHNKQIRQHINHITKHYNDLIFKTPINENDDYFILLIALIGKFDKIITNDHYGDHLDLFLRVDDYESYHMLKDMIVTCINIGKKKNCITIKFSKNISNNYSNCIQVINGIIYIPSNFGYFYNIIDI